MKKKKMLIDFQVCFEDDSPSIVVRCEILGKVNLTFKSRNYNFDKATKKLSKVMKKKHPNKAYDLEYWQWLPIRSD